MWRSTVVIELASDASLARDLAAGGVFVPGCTLGMAEECELVVCGASRRVSVPARVVYVDEHRGAGLELIGFSTAMREQLAGVAPIGPSPEARDPGDEDDLAVPIAIDADDADAGDRTAPVSRAAHAALDDLAVPIANDAGDDYLTIPISTGVHPAVDAEPAPPVPPVADRAEDDVALPPTSGAGSGDHLARRAASGLPIESDPAIAIAEADAAFFDGGDGWFDGAGAVAEPDVTAEPADHGLEPPEAAEPPDAGDPGDTDDAGDRRGEPRSPRNVHERLRGLPLAAQLKLATSGELHERIVLERLYGKNVWETLLRNPRLTPPEVSRIARYGSLPRVLIEIILASGAWLQVPEVRRALLGNPRLGTDQIMKVLRLVPRHELRLAAIQTAYPQAVRNAARLLLGGA